MKATLFLFIVSFYNPGIEQVTVQCPDRATIYRKLSTIESTPERPLQIRAATALHQECVRCRITNDSVYAKLLHVLGRAYWKEGELAKALMFTRQAIAINRHRSPLTREANLANSYTNLGLILTDQGNYLSALKAFDESIRLARRYPEKYYVGAMALEKQATLYFEQGDYEKARRAADQGFLLAQRADNPALMLQNQVQQAQALMELRQYTLAETILHQIVSIAESLNDPQQLTNVLSVKAELHRVLKQYPAAIQHYRRAFDINRQADFRYGCGQVLTNLGYLYQVDLNDPPKALLLYQQALEYIDEPNARASVIKNIGYIYKSRNDYQQALTFFQQAFRIHTIGFKARNLVVNPASATIQQLAQKDYLYELVQGKADTWLDWAKATHNNKTYLRNALKTYMLADTMIDYMRWEHAGQQSKLFWRNKTRPLYERAIETCYRLGDAANAFHFLEKSRAVLLADKLNELGARKQQAPQQAAREQQLRTQVRYWQNVLSALMSSDKAYNPTREKRLTAQDELDAFLKQLEKTNPAYYRYKYDNSTATLAQLQHWLSEQTSSLATFFVSDSTIYIVGVTPHTVKLIRQPLGDYASLSAKFSQLLATPQLTKTQYAQLLSTGYHLYRQLLVPAALPDGRVIVSPDGFFLPFDAFSRSSGKADFVLNYQSFSYTYSASVLIRERREASPTGSFLGMAPVQFTNAVEQVRLPGSDESVQRIGQQFSSPLVFSQQAATKAAFLKNAPHHRVIQLFTHADADTAITDSGPGEPRLFFADSTLRFSEITDNELFRSELLVLSACKTGIGANQRGEGIFSLARGFATVGIPSIVTTLWNVENQPTYQITEMFYQHLAEGLPKDVALQQAKLDLIRQGSKADEQPNRWAGFILIGYTDPLNRPQGYIWLAGLFGLILSGITGWLFVRRKKVSSTVKHR